MRYFIFWSDITTGNSATCAIISMSMNVFDVVSIVVSIVNESDDSNSK